MKPIRIEFVDQAEQRYATVGDYGETGSEVWFRITRFDNPAYSFAVLLHELVERFRNQQFNITDEEVDDFDLRHPELSDPGADPRAPYHTTHMEADAIERLFICLTRNDWNEYEAAIAALFTKEEPV